MLYITKKDIIDFMALMWASMLRLLMELVCILDLCLQSEKRRRRAEKTTAVSEVENTNPMKKTIGTICSSTLIMCFR